MSRFLGNEYAAFAEALTHGPVQGLRVNTLKSGVEEFRRISPFPLGKVVPGLDVGLFVIPKEQVRRHTQNNGEHDEDDQGDLKTLVFAGHESHSP